MKHLRLVLLFILIASLFLAACAPPTQSTAPKTTGTDDASQGFISENIQTEVGGSSLFMGIFLGLIFIATVTGTWYLTGKKKYERSVTTPLLQSKHRKIITAIVGTLLFFTWFMIGGYTTIDQGEVGVVVRQGKAVRTANAGGLVMVPYLDRVVKLKTRVWTYATMTDPKLGNEDYRDTPVTMLAKGGVNVAVVYTIQGDLDPKRAIDLYTHYGTLENAIGQSVKFPSRTIVRTVLLDFTADDMLDDLDTMAGNVREQVAEQMAKAGLNLTLFQFRKPTLGKNGEYEAQLDARQTAVKQALTEAEKVQVEKQKALQQEQIATGDKLKQIQAAQGAAEQTKLSADAAAYQTKVAADADAYRVRTKALAEAEAIKSVEASLATGPQYLNWLRVNAWLAGGAQVPNTVVGSDAATWLQLGPNTNK